MYGIFSVERKRIALRLVFLEHICLKIPSPRKACLSTSIADQILQFQYMLE